MYSIKETKKFISQLSIEEIEKYRKSIDNQLMENLQLNHMLKREQIIINQELVRRGVK